MTVLAQLLPSITSPVLAWAGVAAVSVPIAIHLLTRLRRRPVAWGAMRFLIEAFRRHRHRLRLEQWLLLALRCLILAALGLALSRPLVDAPRGSAASSLAAGRTLCIVLDDSLSTRIATAAGAERFERLRSSALALLDALGPTDEVAIWRAARPVREAMVPASIDHGGARRILEQMRPRFSRCELSAALQMVSAELDRADETDREVLVAVLSDLAHDALDLDRPRDPVLARLGERARFLVAPPMVAADNVQIMSIQPLRHLVLSGADRNTPVPFEVRLRRFTSEAPAATDQVELSVLGMPDTTVWRRHQWAPGEQVSPSLNLTLSIPETTDLPRSIVVTARVVSRAGERLKIDDARHSVVELRRRLTVAVVDEAAGAMGTGPSPKRWLSAALAPRRGRLHEAADAVSLLELAAATLPADRLADVDAAMVLRPDLMNRDAWVSLRAVVDRGGLVAVFVPAVSTSTAWAGALRDVMGVDVQLGLDVLEAPAASPWALVSEGTVPGVFDHLAADWRALLRPVRVHKRTTLAAGGDASAVWLRLADVPDGLLMAGQRVGDGTVVVLATAVDPEWTNLPTKPLWPPLLHEMLRGALGGAGEAARLADLVVGDRPALGRRWGGVQTLVGVGGEATADRVLLTPTPVGSGRLPAQPIGRPGVYAAEPSGAMKLAVNVDADAGDTRALNRQAVARWFGAVGDWEWLNTKAPAATLARQESRIDITLPLLYVTLALVLLETCAARWFSHAAVVHGRGGFLRDIRVAVGRLGGLRRVRE